MSDTRPILEIHRLFTTYRQMLQKALAQVSDADLDRTLALDGNSIAILVKHLAGNMRSRFTDFLTSDGEKPWRDRDSEFEGRYKDREAMMEDLESGWKCLFAAIDGMEPEDLDKAVYIRGEEHTAREALGRQLAHYAYHVGQVVLLARTFQGDAWRSLSIPKGGSIAFNASMDAQRKKRNAG